MPFAFESGVVHNKDGPDESGLYTFTVSGADAEVYHNYQIPSGLGNYLTINNGDAVTAFQVFASGFYVDDYVSDSGLMNDYADSGITAYSTVVLSRVPDVSGLSYSTTFVSGLIEDTVPKGINLHYRIIE